MRLHEDSALFREAILATAQLKGIREIYIEKDYWVTFALHTLFHDAIGKELVFKGGTALLKCFHVINRFSEDIDLVVVRKTGESGNQLKSKIRKISACINHTLPETKIPGLSNKVGMIRKTAHVYPRLFDGLFGQVRDTIIAEVSWLGHFEPYIQAKVHSFIYEMLRERNQLQLARDFGMDPFEVQVLCQERTLCEKIMSLVRFSHSADPVSDLRNKIRHIYDLQAMLQDTAINSFLHSDAFQSMLLRVAQDDFVGFKNNNGWLLFHPETAMLFTDVEGTWSKIRNAYTGGFNELVFGPLPDESVLIKTLHTIKTRLQQVNWILQTHQR